MTISTQRFFCLRAGSSEPSDLVLETPGFFASKPAVVKLKFFIPCELRPALYVSAVFVEESRA